MQFFSIQVHEPQVTICNPWWLWHFFKCLCYFLLGPLQSGATGRERDWGQEEKGTTEEDEMAGWHHWLDAHEFGWTPGVGNGQGGLVCCNSRGHKELDTTERLNWTELMYINTFTRKKLHSVIYCYQDIMTPRTVFWKLITDILCVEMSQTFSNCLSYCAE